MPENVLAVAHRAMIAIMSASYLGIRGSNRFGERGSAGQAVRGKGHAAQSDHHFRQQSQIELPSGSGESGGDRRVGMHHGADIGPHLIDGRVHGDFAGALRAPGDFIPFMSTMMRSSTCIIPLDTPVGVAKIRSESMRMVILPSLAATHPFLEYQAANLHDVFAILALRFHHCGTFDCSKDAMVARD